MSLVDHVGVRTSCSCVSKGHVHLSIFYYRHTTGTDTATVRFLSFSTTTWTGLVVFSNHSIMIVVWQHNRAAGWRGSIAASTMPVVPMFHIVTRTAGLGMTLAAATPRRV